MTSCCAGATFAILTAMLVAALFLPLTCDLDRISIVSQQRSAAFGGHLSHACWLARLRAADDGRALRANGACQAVLRPPRFNRRYGRRTSRRLWPRGVWTHG